MCAPGDDASPDARMRPRKETTIDPRYLPKRNEGNEQEGQRRDADTRSARARVDACSGVLVCWITHPVYVRMPHTRRRETSLLRALNTAHKRDSARSGLNDDEKELGHAASAYTASARACERT